MPWSYRADSNDYFRIPIYEGEWWLRDLGMENIALSVNIGAEITLQIDIGRDYKVTASGTVVSTKQKADVEFQIKPIRMPSMGEMKDEKDKVMEEIENAITPLKDPNQAVKFRRSVRRLEGDFITASRAAEPDSESMQAGY